MSKRECTFRIITMINEPSTKCVYYVDYFPSLQMPDFDLFGSLLVLAGFTTDLALVD